MKNLENLLKSVSAKDTCWPGCADGWTKENPSWGHCAMYALFVWEYIGSESVQIVRVEAVLPDGKVISHYLNRMYGVDYDLSRSQFPDGVTFRNRKDDVGLGRVFSNTGRERDRYEIFRGRVFEEMRRIIKNRTPQVSGSSITS